MDQPPDDEPKDDLPTQPPASDDWQPDRPMSRNPIVPIAVVFEGGLAVVAGGVGLLIGFDLWADLRMDWAAALWGAAAALPPLALMMVLTRWPIGPLRGTAEVVKKQIVPLFHGCSAWDLATVSLLAGLGEEALFRGLIHGAVAEYAGSIAGVVVASVLFGLVHCITPMYVVMAGLIGAYLSLLWMATGNLLAPMVAHAVYDFFALVYLVRRFGEGRDGVHGN